MPTPVFRVYADGKDITPNLTSAGLMTMTITDSDGDQADTLQIDIDDPGGVVPAPRTGATLNPVGGYEELMRDFGQFVVDSVNYSGWPQRISVGAKSVDAKSEAKKREPKAFPPDDYPTYGDIFESVAGKIGLTLRMDPSLKSISNQYEAQADENALEFLTRIGEKINASITVKAKNLVVVVKGAGKSASGASLSRVIVSSGVGGNILSYSVNVKDEPKHSKVKASWYDRAENEFKTEEEDTGLDGPEFLIRTPFQNQAEAKSAAAAQARELKRMSGDANFAIDGAPFAQSGAIAAVSGCRQGVDGLWRIATVTHQFSAYGPYVTTLACGEPSEEQPDG
ncbi:phage protein D [Ancylobacter sp. 3268]|uniref:phage late control D family protein n=1 Tax=Ancylobacter sp. 3268 TaxID=2817752 RepID=UPI0028644D79|nr:late control protein D [Ancylobacter sp. 3268]MDR6954113.1 phage protein D [Ancylobacter sp. 3268]